MKSILALFCFLPIIINGQEGPDPSSFFPSSVGNVWEYSTDHGFVRQVIYSDSIADDGSKYLFSAPQTNPIFKIDTANFVYYLPFHLNWKYYKLDADLGETWISVTRYNVIARVDEIYTAYLWGEERYVKKIGFYRASYPDTTVTEDAVYERYVLLVSGIGEYYEFNYESGPERILLGCTIDGVTYGMVDVEEPPEIPSEFTLYQNYPNPFNPTTTIEYALSRSAEVTLRIYNIIGEEVMKLAEGYQQAGRHKVIFDARGLPSGVYIYTLVAGEKITSGKMILSK